MATIKDVAKLAGLGTSTVSRYYNKTGFVSKDAASKIQWASKELRYSPNALARAVKTKKSYTICLIIPDISKFFYAQLCSEIEQTCLRRGYKVLLSNACDNEELENVLESHIQHHAVDGVIITAPYTTGKKIQVDIPTVFLEATHALKTEVTVVTSNHYEGSRMACEYLIQRGCKKLLYLMPDEVHDLVKLRQKGFEDMANQYTIPYDSLLIKELDEERLRLLYKEGYDGVCAWNDITAAMFMDKCRALNIAIPKEMQLIGYDNVEISKYLYPTLTTIGQPIEVIGKYAADNLIDILEKKQIEQVTLVLDNKLVIRDSTKNR